MVFMMDSWWNPSVEYQAMDRIHRLGQKRPVKVIKLVVEDSIEDQVSHRSSSSLISLPLIFFPYNPPFLIETLAFHPRALHLFASSL